MPPVGFEPTISASEPPQTYALDRAATGTGVSNASIYKNERAKTTSFLAVMMPHYWVTGSQCFEDNVFLRNVVDRLTTDEDSYPRRTGSSTTPL